DVLDQSVRAAVARRKRATEGADDAGRHGSGEDKWIADGHDELTETESGGVAERGRGGAPSRRLDDGEVRQGIATDHEELELGAVDERGRSTFGARDDVGRGPEG